LDPPFVKNQINQRYSLVYCFCFWPKKWTDVQHLIYAGDNRFIERWILLLIGLSLLWTGVAGPAGGAAEGRGAPPS
jgi:hypothetical protein